MRGIGTFFIISGILLLGSGWRLDAYTSDSLIIVVREVSRDSVSAGETIRIFFNIENGEISEIKGFFLSDQVPSSFNVIDYSVAINGDSVGEYTFEIGNPNEIYEVNTPHRWVFEAPCDFKENNPIPAGGTAEIEYLIECPQAGVYVFRNFSWAGALVRESNTLWVFGYDDDSLRIVVGEVGLNEDPPYLGRLRFSLFTSYPNPFKNSTTICYELPSRTYVSIRVYDGSGRVVRRLFEEAQLQGRHYISWDREDLPNGVYFLWLAAGQYATTRKTILMR